MHKGDKEALGKSKLYLENEELFNYYLHCIVEFSQQFDPTETLMIIADDPERRDFIHNAPDALVPLSYIIEDLWPKLGFLPLDPENQVIALIAEYMLNEIILKNSESLDKLNLQHLKELFGGDDEEDEDIEKEYNEEMNRIEEGVSDDDDKNSTGQIKKLSKAPADMSKKQPPSDDEEDNYSSDDDGKFGMDVGALRKRDMEREENDEEF